MIWKNMKMQRQKSSRNLHDVSAVSYSLKGAVHRAYTFQRILKEKQGVEIARNANRDIEMKGRGIMFYDQFDDTGFFHLFSYSMWIPFSAA